MVARHSFARHGISGGPPNGSTAGAASGRRGGGRQVGPIDPPASASRPATKSGRWRRRLSRNVLPDCARSRDEIRESESKFRELAEAIHEVFWVAAPDGSKVQYVSPAYEEVWGRSRESIYKDPRSFTEAVVQEDRPRVLAALEKMAANGIDEEYRITRPDGTTRWIHDRGYAVRNEAGNVQRMVGIAADVTVAKTAQDALWRAHEELEQRVAARTAELQQANEALRRSEADLVQAKERRGSSQPRSWRGFRYGVGRDRHH